MIDMIVTITVGEVTTKFKGTIDTSLIPIPTMEEPDGLATFIAFLDQFQEDTTKALIDDLQTNYMRKQ